MTKFHVIHVHADFDTPVSAFLKLSHHHEDAFLFESVAGAERWNRFSIIGIGARRRLIAKGDKYQLVDSKGQRQTLEHSNTFELLNGALGEVELPEDAPSFIGGMFGYFAYEAITTFEPIPRVGSESTLPDANFVEPQLYGVFDRSNHRLSLYSTETSLLEEASARLRRPLPLIARSPSSAPKVIAPKPEQFQDGVKQLIEHIKAGDLIQCVLSRKFKIEGAIDPFDVYRGLRVINPSPYLFFLKQKDLAIAGSSPEVMVRVEQGRATVRPIAGTRRRGETPDEDAKLAQELLADPKERAEHVMLVDLGRNDLGRTCQAGSVNVSEEMVVENYSHVMHIVSEVQGELVPGATMVDALKACFPAGTLSGAPKIKAMQLIADYEPEARGIYGGAIGYITPQGEGDFGIAIRTIVEHEGKMTLQAGAGIVLDSDPQRETQETIDKATAVVRAAQWAATADAHWPNRLNLLEEDAQ